MHKSTLRMLLAIVLTGALALIALPASAAPTDAQITGTVTASVDGSPIAGAVVYVRDDNGDSLAVAPVTTDAQGTFVITGLSTATYELIAMKSGYAMRHPSLVVAHTTTGAITTGVSITLSPGSSITGKVTDASGNPVAGAQVVAIDSTLLQSALQSMLLIGNGDLTTLALTESLAQLQFTNSASDSPGFTRTKADGTYEIDGLTPSAYLLGAEIDGHMSAATQNVTLSGATTAAPVFVVPSGATVSGHVKLPDGSTVAGAQVQVDPWLAQTTAGAFVGGTTISDAHGAYSMSGLAPGLYSVSVTSDGYAYLQSESVTIGANLANQTLDLTTSGDGSISGSITDASTSAPVQGAAVQVDGGMASVSTTSKSDGTYSVRGMPADAYSVTVTAPGYLPATVNTTTLATSKSNATYSVALQPGSAIVGVVRDSNGTPIDGATVTANADPASGGSFSATSLPDGSYTIDSLPAGSYKVTAQASGSAQPASVPVAINAPSSRVQADVTMRPLSAATRPDAPQVLASAGYSGALLVMVTPPRTNGGNPITGYTVVAQPGSHRCTTYFIDSCEVKGLLGGTKYTVHVTANNEVGASPVATATAWTDAVLSPDNIVSKASKPGQSTITFTQPPTLNVITGYKVEYKSRGRWLAVAVTRHGPRTVLVKGFARHKVYAARISPIVKSGRVSPPSYFPLRTG